ncbi:MAG: polyprenyl diphosphate synthase [Planctomycetota bacterium]
MTSEVPRHIAFIMDGNGRWAERQGLPRLRGHERGAAVLREVVQFCARAGVSEVTFYALSTENYRQRPPAEVEQLMALLEFFLVNEREEIARNDLRLRAIGRIHELPSSVRRELTRSLAESKDNQGMILRLALNYGGRREITDAVIAVVEEIRAGRSPDEFLKLTESEFAQYLYDPSMTDPDLLVRTAGELRLSNFLLWHISYAELWVTDSPWPDFGPELLRKAFAAFGRRVRKFGSVVPSVRSPEESG